MTTQTQARCNSLLRKHKELNLEKKFSCWEEYCQMEQKMWLKCMIGTDKPDINCFEYEIWKFPCFSVLISWKFDYRHSLMPNDLDPAVFHPFSCVPNVVFRGRASTAAAVIVHTPKQFFYLIFSTWSSLLFQGISDFKLAIGQSHSAWQLLTLNAELKSCNMTRSGL